MSHYHITGTRASEIVDCVERLVRDGVLPTDTRLPPIRDLAEQLELSPTTVAAAYKTLGRRGVVQTRGRKGTVVASRPPVRGPLSAPSPRTDLRDLASGNPDPELLIPPALLLDGEGSGHVLYGTSAFTPQLEQAARARFEADGIDGSALVPTNGSLDAIERALASHLRFGDRVGVEDPGYAAVLDLVPALGYLAVPLAVDDEGVAPEALAQAADGGLSAVILTPRAQNPTGAAFSPARAAALEDILRARPGILVIEDDHAGDIAGAPTTWVGRSSPSWVVVRSASKSIGPDLRLAVSAGDDTTIARIMGRFALGPGWVSHHLQRMAAVAWSSDELGERLAHAAATYAQRREALLAQLRQRDVAAHGTSGFNVWVHVPDELTAVQRMADHGWSVAGGARFRHSSAPAIRVTTSTLAVDEAAEVAAAVSAAVGRGGSGAIGVRGG